MPASTKLIIVVTLLFGNAPLFAEPAKNTPQDWPQWRGPTRDGVWHETGIMENFPAEKLEARWEVPISSGYNGPTVADGRVYVSDRVVEPEQQERVHCIDFKSGEVLWTHAYNCVYRGISYTAGPRSSITIHDGKAYHLGAMGNLFCLDAEKGTVLWSRDLNVEYEIRMPIWGIAASPLIDGELVIVQIGGSNGRCLVAFDKNTGKERWTALEDQASYSSPILLQQAGKPVLACLTGASVVGLNPQTGELYWHVPFKPSRMPIGIATPVLEQERLFVTSFYDGSLMLNVKPSTPAVEQLWRAVGPNERNTQALHSIISTPYLQGDYVYGVDSYGELRCLDAKTGERIWESEAATPKARWSTIHFVKNADKVWMFNERGELLITKLSPKGFEEIDRAKIIEPTTDQLRQRGGVCWSHPAFAYKHIIARNDKKIVCVNLAAE